MKFTIHNQQTAPAAAQPVLAEVEKSYQFIPNLLGVLAESPLALSAYTQLNGLIQGSSTLTPQEQQAAMLAVSGENNCGYCMGAHCTIASMVGTAAGTIQALRKGATPEDARTAALVKFTRAVVKQRGWLDDAAVQEFLSAGFNRSQLLDVLVIVGLKTISNYTNHLAETPLDEAFSQQAWAA
ncbi:MAG: carboxymuconolactone decarboxylase family protein [Verrucomicrobiota bacterium]